MPERERFQALMLEHLYGLLEPDELQQLNAYLATPEGAELKALGERWKAQLAGAAKAEFPQVKFAVPKNTPAPAAAPAQPTGHTMKAVWTKWAVAASVLILAGLALPAGIQFLGWVVHARETEQYLAKSKQLQDEVTTAKADHQAQRTAVERELTNAREAQEAALKNYQDALMNARKAIEQKDFMVRLVGPSRVQPGAPNEWQIETLNKNGGYSLPKKLDVVVKDQNNKELLKQSHERPQGGPASLKLPASFWEGVKPGSELYLEVIAYNDNQQRSVLAEKVPLAQPIYVTHLATDKPLYKPSEVVRFRSLTLDRATFLPPEQDMNLKFRLKTPEGAVVELDQGNGRVMDGVKPVLGPDRKPVRGIGTGEYDLAENAPGGEYALMVFEFDPRNGRETHLESRKFIVNRYVPDVFEKKLEFDGKSYGAGDPVQARIEASRTAGGPLKGARLNITANLDGVEFFQNKTAKLDDKGVFNVRFNLPKEVNTGNVTLSVNIADGSDSEVINRPVPVIGNKLDVSFFPEGGELVAGVPSRVYFQARTPLGKPADLKGVITDGTNTITEVSTMTDGEQAGVNRGQGLFIFTPKANTKYFLKVTTPVSIKDPSPLPEVKADGVVLTAIDPVTDKGDPIRVRLQAGQGTKTLHVGAYARGQLLEHKRVVVTAGKPVELQLTGDAKLGGVARVTVFEEPKNAGEGRANLLPRAERLVYRKPGEQLLLNVTPDKNRYSPMSKVNLELAAFTEKETPTPAVLMVGVVNQSVIRMADNKTDRLMPTHFLLAGDVKSPAELEHADFLLTDHPKAGLALDLLLGTQGWRRFAEQNVLPANPADRQEVDRMLVAHGQRSTTPTELYRLEEQRVNAEFTPKLEQATLRFGEAESAHLNFMSTDEVALQQREQMAQLSANTARKQYEDSAAELHQFEVQTRTIRGMALPMFFAGLILFALASFIVVVARQRGERAPFMFAGGGAFAMATLVIIGLVVTASNSDHARYYVQRNQKYDTMAMNTVAPGMAANRAAVPPMAPEAAAMGAGGPVPADGREWQDNAKGFGGGRGGANADPRKMPPAPMPAPQAKVPGLHKPANLDAMAADKLAEKFAKEMGKQEQAEARKDLIGGDAKNARDEAKKKVVGDLNRLRKAQQNLQMGRQLRDQAKMIPGGGARGPAGGMPAPGIPGGFGGFGEGKGDRMVEMLPPATMPFIVREYAHTRDASLNDVRSDFTETVYWHPVLVLPDNGKTTIGFQLSDDVARYQVLVAGHTVDGRIGAITKTIEARKPFTVDPKVPLEVNSNDIVDVPVRIMNDSDERRVVSFTMKPSQLKIEGGLITMDNGFTKDNIDLLKNQPGRKVFRVRPSVLQGEALLVVEGQSEPAAEPDAAARAIRIVPEGFPGVGSISDILEQRANGTVNLPKDMVPGTLKAQLEVYPTSMSDLVKGLEGLMREPGGCFEQTSTNNYPNTLILNYLNQTNQANPEVSKRAKDMLDRGYGRLIAYECPDTPLKLKQGFEWFGGADMAHEALTAYGLLQFKDMAKVHPVDPEMIKRTQAFLLSRRDGEGGFKRNGRALDSFGGAPKHTTDAYIVWALVESDPDDTEKMNLTKEIDALRDQAFKAESREGKDAYFVALVANILLQRGQLAKGMELLDRLKDKHFKYGFVQGGETSITRSGGRDLDIEVTALVMLGWMRANDNAKYGATVKQATKWISQQRGGYGGFGSTQSTIMALKALITYAKKMAHPSESGEVVLTVDGKRVASKKFTDKDVEVIALEIEKPEEIFKPGVVAQVNIETDAKQPYPFSLNYSFTTLTPVSADKCAVTITTKLAKSDANEGDTVPLNVTLTNKLKTDHGMAVAVIGVPAGMKVPTDMKQLIDLREKGTISYFETRGRELVLYWRGLGPEQKINVSIDLVCDVPGEYRGPASRGYLYYNADHKHWVEPLTIKIKPVAAKDEVAGR